MSDLACEMVSCARCMGEHLPSVKCCRGTALVIPPCRHGTSPTHRIDLEESASIPLHGGQNPQNHVLSMFYQSRRQLASDHLQRIRPRLRTRIRLAAISSSGKGCFLGICQYS